MNCQMCEGKGEYNGMMGLRRCFYCNGTGVATEPAPATDAPMSDFVEVLLRQQNATPEQRQAVRDSLSKPATDAAALGVSAERRAIERAERAEAALAEVGKQLEIADTRNTDMVLELERAEGEAKRLREALTKIGENASWWVENDSVAGLTVEDMREVCETVDKATGSKWLVSSDKSEGGAG